MAFLTFKLSESQRVLLSRIIYILIIMVILANSTTIVGCIFICAAVAPKIFSERAEINFVFAVIALDATTTIFVYSSGIIVCRKCIKQPEKKSTRKLVAIWSYFSFYLTFMLIILASLSRKINKHIVRSMKHSFQIGMRNYLSEKSWKIAIDEIQYNLQCCGIKSFKDWHNVQWLNKYHLNFQAETVKQFTDVNGNLEVTPWSCCRLNFPTQCYHDPFQQNHEIWTENPRLVVESINHNGCLNILRVPILYVLVAFIILVSMQFILQVVTFLLLRILYTSCRNNALLNDPNGLAPGWLFGRGDCGYNKGKTIYEIMYGKQSKNEEESLIILEQPETEN